MNPMRPTTDAIDPRKRRPRKPHERINVNLDL